MKLLRATLSALILLVATMTARAGETVTVTPEDTGEALVNPGMGWTVHFYSNVPSNYGSRLEPSDTLEDFPGLSTVYLRLPWSYIEPHEGEFNWAMIDTPAQRWIARGKRIALRVTCSENWMPYATPKWVRDAGAKGTFYQYGKGPTDKGGAWDPFFDDPVFMEKLDRFLAAYAARYDGNPNVEFVDVGSFGLWGEGHTHASSRQDRFDIQKQHIDLHLKHFKRTLLCVSDDLAGFNKPGKRFPITDYALSKGITLRDDSILTDPRKDGPPWHHAEMAQAFWPRHPVILEHQHVGPSKQLGTWDPGKVIASVEAYHASFMSIHGFPREYLEQERGMIDAINLRLGYRLMPVSVAWPRVAPIATRQDAYVTGRDVTAASNTTRSFKVEWSWANKGVAPCHQSVYPALTLKDDNGGIVSVLVDETLDLRELQVGEAGTAPVTKRESEFIVGLHAPTTRPGEYDVYVSVGQRDGSPIVAMPLRDGDGQRRYKLGRITLVAGEADGDRADGAG